MQLKVIIGVCFDANILKNNKQINIAVLIECVRANRTKGVHGFDGVLLAQFAQYF